MASRKHCDVCDSDTDVASQIGEAVRIDAPNNLVFDLRVDASFLPRYRTSDDAPVDLCNECKRKVFGELFKKHGGKVEEPF